MKAFFAFLKQAYQSVRHMLTPKEWSMTITTFILSGILVSSVFWANPNASEEVLFEALGYNLKVKTENGANLSPFHTYYYVLYEKIYPQSHRDRVKEILNEEVPLLHKVSDRSTTYHFLIDDNQPDLGRLINLRDVNESLGSDEWIAIPHYLYDILSIGKQLTIDTNSNFNFFVGKLSDFWEELIDDFGFPFEYQLLDPYYNATQRAYLEELLSYVPKTEAEVNSTLELEERNDGYYAKFNAYNGSPVGKLEITLGGIAKGYANDVISARLMSERLTHGYISGGQSSNTALGTRHNDQTWSIPMSSPLPGVQRAYIINRTGYFNISTSGGYQGVKIIIEDEQVWRHHIINAWDGYPSRIQFHVNVMSKDVPAAALDALSTALMNMTIEEGMALRQTYIDRGLELEISWIDITPENTLAISHTEGFTQYMTTIPENSYFVIEKLS